MIKFKFITKAAIALCVMLVVVLSSCESQQDVQSDIERLKNERTTIQQEVQNLSGIKNSKQKEITSLNEKLKELNIYNSGKKPHYILKIRLKQSRVSLDIGKHIKDGMNTIEFELPVDKDFYNSVSVGTKITDEFRTGSFILNGSFSSWDILLKVRLCGRHHLPNSSEDDIESIFNWCYNRASAMEGTSSPKNFTILDSFQNFYLKLD